MDLDKEILDKYSNRLNNLKFLIINISQGVCSANWRMAPKKWRIKDYDLYYGMNLSNSIAANSEMVAMKLDINIMRLVSYYLLRNDPIDCSILERGAWKKEKDVVSLEQSGKDAAEKHNVENDKDYEENKQAIYSIIDFAKRNKVKIIFYAPPAFKSYREHLNKKQWDKGVRLMKTIECDNNNCLYFDWIDDNSFTESDFYNADHLNKMGAKKLTSKINEVIEECIK